MSQTFHDLQHYLLIYKCLNARQTRCKTSYKCERPNSIKSDGLSNTYAIQNKFYLAGTLQQEKSLIKLSRNFLFIKQYVTGLQQEDV